VPDAIEIILHAIGVVALVSIVIAAVAYSGRKSKIGAAGRAHGNIPSSANTADRTLFESVPSSRAVGGNGIASGRVGFARRAQQAPRSSLGRPRNPHRA
jgi:hypothetical protein